MKKIILIAALLLTSVFADDLRVAAGGGYKQVVLNIISEYEKTNPKVDSFFGHMPQIATQAKNGNIPLLIGDKNHLLAQNIKFKEYKTLGRGYAVIIYPKGVSLNSTKDLLNSNIKKIAMPQPQKAVFGTAGLEFLQNEKLYDKVKDKLLQVSGVPQVVAYVIANEVDAGIVNLTVALDNIDKIGGYVKIDDASYTSIEIIAGVMDSCDSKCENFYKFLDTNTTKDILKKFGM
ncbi:MAG: molybdate ABC transporter substrate-binding protein [Campylobacteraceae bacterium]